MRSLLKAAVGPGELVLDFFAGAATTAQAVMELNEEDGGDLPLQSAPDSTGFTNTKHEKRYALRDELLLPQALIREELPEIYEIAGDLTTAIAQEFCQSLDLRAELNRRLRRATLSLRDLFLADEQQRIFSVRFERTHC
jgi:hypothetical protein